MLLHADAAPIGATRVCLSLDLVALIKSLGDVQATREDLRRALQVFQSDGDYFEYVVRLLELALSHQVKFFWMNGNNDKKHCYVVVSLGSAVEFDDRRGTVLLKSVHPIPPTALKDLPATGLKGLPPTALKDLPASSFWRSDWSASVPYNCSTKFYLTGWSKNEAAGAAVLYACGGTLWKVVCQAADQLTAQDLFDRSREARTLAGDAVSEITLQHAEDAVALLKVLRGFKPEPAP